MSENDLILINQSKELLNQASKIWQTNFLLVFLDTKTNDLMGVLIPLSQIHRKPYYIKKYVNINRYYLATVFSYERFNEELGLNKDMPL